MASSTHDLNVASALGETYSTILVDGEWAAAHSGRTVDVVDPAQTGPLISAKQLERVSGYIQTGVADGARLGGRRIADGGYFIEPTVLTNMPTDTALRARKFSAASWSSRPLPEVDEALALANDTDYGLSSSVRTMDVRKAHAAARELRAERARPVS